MNIIKLERGGVGNNPCTICSELHIPQNRCRHEALVKKISLLSEANSHIPAILQANKEAVDTATQFQNIIKQADMAHTLLLEILAEHGDVGEDIKTQYLTKLDKLAATIQQVTVKPEEKSSIITPP